MSPRGVLGLTLLGFAPGFLGVAVSVSTPWVVGVFYGLAFMFLVGALAVFIWLRLQPDPTLEAQQKCRALKTLLGDTLAEGRKL
jgi:hypothetical protein